ncbi:MAG TPA: hypothetical protein VML19_33850 [Verrucomicrobiae bacterium]|nr:hypothetical protein [Verrucomicrobiae bacterium]
MHSKLILGIALILLVANVQCVASCMAGCGASPATSTMPPCHHHPSQPTKASACPHHSDMAPAPAAMVIAMPASTAMAAAPEFHGIASAPRETWAGPSPPPGFSTVLRI